MKDDLPDSVVPYKRTPIFDQHSLPAGLRREHRTKPGVWALIQVLEGRLLYRVLAPRSEQVLLPAASERCQLRLQNSLIAPKFP